MRRRHLTHVASEKEGADQLDVSRVCDFGGVMRLLLIARGEDMFSVFPSTPGRIRRVRARAFMMLGVYLLIFFLGSKMPWVGSFAFPFLPLPLIGIIISTMYERRFFDRISAERELGHERCFECHYRTDKQAEDTPVCAECGFSRAESARLWQRWRPQMVMVRESFRWWKREPKNKPRDDRTNKLPLV